jgi:hypothetical protein
MTVRSFCWRALVGLAAALLAQAEAQAGPIREYFHLQRYGCCPSQYSHLHYCAPTLWRAYACLKMSHLGPLAPDVNSTLPATTTSFKVFAPRCPYVNPAAFYPPPTQQQ